jgi:hypothetical protein
MPKAKPVSLHPLSFEEAVRALINTTMRKPSTQKKTKRKRPK